MNFNFTRNLFVKYKNLDLEKISKQVSINLGSVENVFCSKKPKGHVFLFEENHLPIQTQIEIGQMFFRLYKNHGLKTIGLEGVFIENHDKPDFIHSLSEKERLNLSARLLAEGELNCADFMNLSFNDIQVKGIDSEKELNEMEEDNIEPVISVYWAIIEDIQRKNKEQREDIANRFNNALESLNLDRSIEPEKGDNETLEGAILSNKWASGILEKLGSNLVHLSPEESVAVLEEILSEARSRGLQVPTEATESIINLENINSLCHARSDVMASKIAFLCKKEPARPIACNVGAAHTERMLKRFEESRLSYCVIRPNTFNIQKEKDLVTLDYDRRKERLTQSTGYLGELFDRLKKPTSIISQNWFSIKGNLYNIVYRITEATLVQTKPLKTDDLNLPSNFNINIDEIENIDGNLVFSIEIKTDGTAENIWVKSTFSDNVIKPTKDLEKIENSIQFLLGEINGEIQAERFFDDHTPQTYAKNVVKVSNGVFAIFSNDKENVLKDPLLIPKQSDYDENYHPEGFK